MAQELDSLKNIAIRGIRKMITDNEVAGLILNAIETNYKDSVIDSDTRITLLQELDTSKGEHVTWDTISRDNLLRDINEAKSDADMPRLIAKNNLLFTRGKITETEYNNIITAIKVKSAQF